MSGRLPVRAFGLSPAAARATRTVAEAPNNDLVAILVEGKHLDPIVVVTSVERLELVPASVTLT